MKRKAIMLVVATTPRLIQTPAFVERFADNPENTGFAYATRHPGTVYFPFAPLITLMSEGKAYHFSDGVYQQLLAGVTVTREQLEAGLPPHLTTVAFRGAQDFSARYLPQFSEPASDPELPGWTIRRRRGG